MPSLHTCAVRHWLARLCPTQLLPAAALQARLGIRAQSSVLRAWVRHCSTLQVGIAKSSALPTGCLGLGCALWSVNEHSSVHVRLSLGEEGGLINFLKGFLLSFGLNISIQISADRYFKPVTSNQCEHSLQSVYCGCQYKRELAFCVLFTLSFPHSLDSV